MSNRFDFQKCRQDQDIFPQGQHNSGLVFLNQVDYIPLGIDRMTPHLWPAIGATFFHFLAFGNVCSTLKTAENTCKQSQITYLSTFAQFHTTFM